MKILVIGATGAMGSAVVDRMSQMKHSVFALSRRPYYTTNDYITPVVGDAFNIDFLQKVLENKFDCVIDFLWHSIDTFKKSFDLICSNTSQYIFMSSSAVYINHNLNKINEECTRFIDLCESDLDKDIDNLSEYHMVKAQLEEYAKSSKFNNWTIVRPNLVFSKDSLRIGLFAPDLWCYRAVHNRTIVLPKEMMDVATAYLTANDAAKIYEILIGNSKALSNTFNIASEQTITIRNLCEFVRMGLEEAGYHFQIKEIPLKKFLIGFPSAKSRMLRDRIYNRVFDMSRVKALGSYEEANISADIIESAKYNALSGKYYNKPFKSIIHGNAFMDRICHEYTHLYEIQGKKNKLIYFIARFGPSYKLQMNIYRKLFRRS